MGCVVCVTAALPEKNNKSEETLSDFFLAVRAAVTQATGCVKQVNGKVMMLGDSCLRRG